MIEINLLSRSKQVANTAQQKIQRGLITIIVIALLLCCVEGGVTFWLRQKTHAFSIMLAEQAETSWEERQPVDTLSLLAEQMSSELNDFFYRWQKIHLTDENHIHLIKLDYTAEKLSLQGEVATLADLSGWLRLLEKNGLHATVKRLQKSSRTNQFRFFVFIHF